MTNTSPKSAKHLQANSHPSKQLSEQPLVDSTLPHSETITLGHYAERAYLEYAVSVVKGRALPDVSDGQKPVQRRLLYAMNEMGLSADAKPVKSARVVGDVLSKFHPHGDQSAYDALVRLAQDFSLRYPLIDGQGNFGSRDGDSAAAMRYTETRLTPFANLLLNEINAGTVSFTPNYDGSYQEPICLPARLPLVLLNGASGIAVGLATEIPSHNCREIAAAAIAILRDPKINLDDILNILPGPDFPGGAQIISSQAEIADVYRSGKGSLKMRARWNFEALAKGQWQCVVTELPPNVSCKKIMEEVEEISNPKIKLGKKTLTSEQQQLKQHLLNSLDCVRDESGRQAPVRLVFEPKSNRIEKTELINILLAHTSLESSVSVNFVMIGLDGRPRQKNILDILQEWTQFRLKTVLNRTHFRLQKIADRSHILEGRLIVFLNIDQVIKTIREADEPKADLIKQFALTERQADDILEIRLRQLAKLEAIKIEKELKELREEAAMLNHLVDHEKALKKAVIKEIETDCKQFGDDRRTLIQHEKPTTIEVRVQDEPVTVIISAKGWARTIKGHQVDQHNLSFKMGDELYACFACRKTDHLIAFANDGRVYSINIAALPGGRGDGVPITSLVDVMPNRQLVHYFAGHTAQKILLAASDGYGLMATIKDLIGRTRSGKSFINLNENQTLLRPTLVNEDSQWIACLSSDKHLLVYAISEIKLMSNGGRGTILMAVDKKQNLQYTSIVGNKGLCLLASSRAGKQSETVLNSNALKEFIGQRARRGKLLTLRHTVDGLYPAQTPSE